MGCVIRLAAASWRATTPDEIRRRGDSYPNQCRMTKACAIACRNERTIKARACKRSERPTCDSLLYFHRRRVSAHCSRRWFATRPGGSRGEEPRVFTRAHHRCRVWERERPRNRTNSRNVVLRITKLSNLPLRSRWERSRILKCSLSPQYRSVSRKLDNAMHVGQLREIIFKKFEKN